MRRPSLLLLVVSAMWMASCSVNSEVNRGDLNVISIDSEWSLGDESAAEIERQVTLVDDPVVADFVITIGQAIADRTELADRAWNFVVVRDPSVNAFALPGGDIYVNTGLIRAIDDVDALAGVLAHEVAHVEARHGTEQLTKAYGTQALIALLGSDSGLVEVAGDLVASGVFSKFSRDAEREADRLGLELLAEAGFDPQGMVEFFEVLGDQDTGDPNALDRFFRTHPLTDERLVHARERAAELQPSTRTPSLSTTLDAVQRELASA